MTLEDYVAEHGEERTAETLSALLGKKITHNTVRLWKSRAPVKWELALGLVEPEPLGSAGAQWLPPADPLTDGGGEGRRAEIPPRPPEGAKVLPFPASGEFARKRIVSSYQFLGAALAEGSGNPGVGKVWDDSSGPIADAWLAAAESSEFARKFVAFMTAGGPIGEVVVCHIILLAGTLYVLGQIPEVSFLAKYSQYRPAPAPAARPAGARADGEAAGSAAASDNGAAASGAGDVLGDVARPFGP
jgi:hypothetical protein